MPAPSRVAWTVALVTTCAAILVRLWFASSWAELNAPASAFYAGDARTFLAYARHLVAGQSFDNGVPFHPPGWAFVLSLFLRAVGGGSPEGTFVSPAALKMFVAALSGISVGLATWLAARLAGSGAMYAVALLGTFHFGHAVVGTVPASEAFYGLLVVATLALASGWLPEAGRPGGGLAPSVALGGLAASATLVRPEFALLALVLGVGRWRLDANRWSSVQALAAAALVFGLGLLPTTVAHWRSLSAFNQAHAALLPGPLPRFAPVTSYGAFNFAMANHPDADGGPNSDHPLLADVPQGSRLDQGQLDLAQPAVYELYVQGWTIGLRWMAGHPADALALMKRKLAMMSGAFALGYLHWDWPAGIEGVRRRVDVLDPDSRVLWLPQLVIALAGAWLLGRQRRARWLLAAPTLALLASTLLFFGYVRLGLAYLPVFWIMQGAALAAVTDAVVPSSSWPRRHVAAVVLAVGVSLLIIDGTGALHPRHVVLEGPRTPDGTLIQDETLVVRAMR